MFGLDNLASAAVNAVMTPIDIAVDTVNIVDPNKEVGANTARRLERIGEELEEGYECSF